MQLGPLGDLLALHLGGDERLALATRPPAHADVAVGRLRFLHMGSPARQLDVGIYPDGYRIELIERG
jgi:hypothetical protein